jgi:hypothetical protein
MAPEDRYTMKTRLVKMLYDRGEAWDYELVDDLKNLYGKSGKYWTWVIRYWTMELSSSSIFKTIDAKIDDGSHFKEGKVVYKLGMSSLGKKRVEEVLL